MIDTLHHLANVNVHRNRVVGRRDFLRFITAGAAAAGTLSFRDQMCLQADTLRQRGMACILLWMQGGPSHFETFSPKPGHVNGGSTKAIGTSVSGIEISENFPLVAKRMGDLAIVRSMTSKEGAHPRATYLMHTGYLPTASVKYPTMGSFVSQQCGAKGLELPSFVRIGGDRGNSGAGILGVDYEPFVMKQAGRTPNNTVPFTDVPRFQSRLDLLGRLEAASSGDDLVSRDPEIADHQKLYNKASKMILSQDMAAFDVDKEPDSVKQAYGSGNFATGCMLARRLVEKGVTFIEVQQNGWDTHNDNFAQCKNLCGNVDQPFAALIDDLKQRGLYETTLVVWMGEFGRTPKINPRGGRDHYPRTFNVVLGGAGIRGGQVIGKTDAGGIEVTDRPVTVPDLFQTFCKSLKINSAFENTASNGRPIKLVNEGAAVSELVG